LFISQIKKGGKLVIKKNLDLTLPENTDLEVYSYSLNQKADFYAKNIKFLDGFYVFDIIVPDGVIENVRLGFLGKMNVENAIAAIGISWILSVPEKIIKKAMLCFTGVKRRFDVRFRSGKIVFIDDYAHHPVELNSVIASVREIFPGKQITGKK
jgi:UDP-N-acetylmuramate--alanine ligase